MLKGVLRCGVSSSLFDRRFELLRRPRAYNSSQCGLLMLQGIYLLPSLTFTSAMATVLVSFGFLHLRPPVVVERPPM
ncbi:hypothetical protein BDV40DRAFT_267798, partial [Aspergillus tamarii]